MKKLIIIPMLFCCYLVIGQFTNSSPIIGKPIRVGNIIVAQNDFKYRLTFDNAKKECAELGKGWRLPTKQELNLLYVNRKKITAAGGGFADADYWSSTVYPSYYAWRQDFTDGYKSGHGSGDQYGYNVRAVNSLPSVVAAADKPINAATVIGKPIKIDNILVAQNDFPYLMNWSDAKESCKKLGKGWRLPTSEELNILYKNRDKIFAQKDYRYWSSSEVYDYARYVDFTNGKEQGEDAEKEYVVRAVKDL